MSETNPHPTDHMPPHAAMRPKIAIIDNNVLATIGLKSLLQNVMPIADIETFSTLSELETAGAQQFMHYFVALKIMLENRPFFLAQHQKTIVLTTEQTHEHKVMEFKTLCISTSEEQLVKAILQLEQYGHPGGRNLPEMPKALKTKLLTDREIEVLAFIAQGFINKEIGRQLNIGLTTVISHRKNITEKLGMKSVSALTIYAVMHGYVDINKI